MNARMYIDRGWDGMGTEKQIMGVGRKGQCAGGNGGEGAELELYCRDAV